jgi:hypothetical protein
MRTPEGDIMITSGLAYLIGECKTDQDLKDAIKALREELNERRRVRLIEKIRKAASTLSAAEREVMDTNGYAIPKADPEILESLRAKKLVFKDSYYFTALGRQVSHCIKEW